MFSKVKRVIAPILSAAMLITILTPALAASEEHSRADFSDVPPTHWAYDAVMYCADKGYVNGKGNNEFKPDDYISQAEVVTVLNRICLDENQIKTWIAEYKQGKFWNLGDSRYNADYEKNDWAYLQLMVANKAGYWLSFRNYALGQVRNDPYWRDPMTREDLAYSLYGALKWRGEYAADDDVNYKGVTHLVKDDKSPPYGTLGYATVAALGYGLMSLDENGRFNKDSYMTRAAICEVFMRLDNPVERELVKTAMGIPPVRDPITIDMRTPTVEHEPPISGDTVIRPDGSSCVLVRDPETLILGLNQNVGAWFGVYQPGDLRYFPAGLVGTVTFASNDWMDYDARGWYVHSNLPGQEYTWLWQYQWDILRSTTYPNSADIKGTEGQIDSTGLWKFSSGLNSWTWQGPNYNNWGRLNDQ